jgi:uncharacterized membrane protein
VDGLSAAVVSVEVFSAVAFSAGGAASAVAFSAGGAASAVAFSAGGAASAGSMGGGGLHGGCRGGIFSVLLY